MAKIIKNQTIVEDDVSILDQAESFHCQQFRVARTGANNVDRSDTVCW